MSTTTLVSHRRAVMRAAIYCRVSADPSGTGRSVEEQEAESRLTCTRAGWRVDDRVYTDNGVGASPYSRGERGAFARLCELIEAGGVDVVVAWECSRLSRDELVYSYLRSLCRRHGVQWCYSGRLYDLDDPEDAFSTGIDGLIAQREAHMTSQRVRRAKHAAAEKGLPSGRNLFGYSRRYRIMPNGAKVLECVEEHPAQAPIVREIARRYLGGEPLGTIGEDLNVRRVPPPGGGRWTARVLGPLVRHPDLAAARAPAVAAALARVQNGATLRDEARRLNADGVPAPTRWSGLTVRAIIQNPAYSRLRVHRGSVLADVEAQWPELIPIADHRAIVARLGERAREQPAKTSHLSSGWVECGVCGAGLVGADASHVRCRSRRRCVRRPVGEWRRDGGPLTGVDDYVSRLVVARLSAPDCLEAFRVPDAGVEQAQAAADAAELRARLDQWMALAKEGQVSPTRFAEAERDLAPKIEDAERRARPRHIPDVLVELAGRPDVAERWAALDLQRRREIGRALVAVKVLPVGRGTRRVLASHFRVGWRTAAGVDWQEHEQA